MHEIIERSLKEDLNQVHLKELVKNDFLRRKVKMNSMDKLLDHRIFEKIYQDSLLSVFRDIVQQELFPIKKKTDPMYAMADQSPDPELKSL